MPHISFGSTGISANTASRLCCNHLVLLLPLLADPSVVPDVVVIATLGSLQALGIGLFNLFPCWPLAVVSVADLEDLRVIHTAFFLIVMCTVPVVIWLPHESEGMMMELHTHTKS